MDLINRSIQYALSAETGNTDSVVVGIHGKSDNLEINGTLTIVAGDLDAGTTFDDLSKKQLFALATKKLPAVLTKLAYSNYQFFVQNDVPVRVTAYSDISETGNYVTLSSTLTSTNFEGHDDLTTVGYADIKAVVSKIIATEFPV